MQKSIPVLTQEIYFYRFTISYPFRIIWDINDEWQIFPVLKLIFILGIRQSGVVS